MPGDKTHTYHQLRKAFEQPGCPICQLVQRGVQGYLKSLFYENVNDPETRLELRHTQGFCYDHAWLLLDAEIGDALGTSIIYHDVLNFTIKAMGQVAEQDQNAHQGFGSRLFPKLAGQGKSLGAIIQPKKRCPVCAERDTTTRLTIGVFASSLADLTFCDAFEHSPGVCFPHLAMTFEHIRDAQAYKNLLRISTKQYGDIRQELAEFIRKNDYRFRDEKIGTEGTAWRRVIGIVVGEKGK